MKFFKNVEITETSLRFRRREFHIFRSLCFILFGVYIAARFVGSYFHNVPKMPEMPSAAHGTMEGFLPYCFVLTMMFLTFMVCSIFVAIPIFAALWAMFGEVRCELNEKGFSYNFRIIVPLERYFFPREDLRGVSFFEESDSVSLAVATDSGTMKICYLWDETAFREAATLIRLANGMLQDLRPDEEPLPAKIHRKEVFTVGKVVPRPERCEW